MRSRNISKLPYKQLIKHTKNEIYDAIFDKPLPKMVPAKRVVLFGSPQSGVSLTRQLLNDHLDVLIVNSIIYDIHYQKGDRDKEELFEFVRNYMNEGPTFVRKCLALLKDDDDLGRIAALETATFENKYFVFGDTLRDHGTIDHLINIGLPFKIIYIYRDIRDILVERGFHQTIQQFWTRDVVRWEEYKKRLEGSYIELRFEDYVDEPERNMNKVAEFLNLEVDDFLAAQERIFDPTKATIRQYGNDWEKRLYSDTKEALKVKGYI